MKISRSGRITFDRRTYKSSNLLELLLRSLLLSITSNPHYELSSLSTHIGIRIRHVAPYFSTTEYIYRYLSTSRKYLDLPLYSFQITRLTRNKCTHFPHRDRNAISTRRKIRLGRRLLPLIQVENTLSLRGSVL